MDLTWYFLSAYAIFLVISGYVLPELSRKNVSRTIAWIIAILTVIISTVLTTHQPPLIRMLVIVYLQLLSMKILVAVETYNGGNKLTLMQWIAFSIGWFGMRPALFEKLPSPPKDLQTLMWKGLTRIVIGFVLLYLSHKVSEVSILNRFFVSQLLLLAGVSFILHFGILNISSASWRLAGVEVSELFRAPYKSTSLKEFWGKRWNLAFSEMTALIAYRPLREKVGPETAVILSFLLSGLLHEIAISFPVNAGYGLPMIYFSIHAAAMQAESKQAFVQRVISHPFWSHVWVMGLLIIPMPLLFHDAFMTNVLIPLRDLLLGV
jgi:hypothetical protein